MLNPRRKLTDIPTPASVTLTADSHLMEDFLHYPGYRGGSSLGRLVLPWRHT